MPSTSINIIPFPAWLDHSSYLCIHPLDHALLHLQSFELTLRDAGPGLQLQISARHGARAGTSRQIPQEIPPRHLRKVFSRRRITGLQEKMVTGHYTAYVHTVITVVKEDVFGTCLCCCVHSSENKRFSNAPQNNGRTVLLVVVPPLPLLDHRQNPCQCMMEHMMPAQRTANGISPTTPSTIPLAILPTSVPR